MSDTSATAPRWLSRSTAAARLGVSARTIIRMEKRGQLDAYRVGRSIRYLSDDVDALAVSVTDEG